MFDGAELRRFVEQARWVAVNDYEGRMLCDRTGQTLESLSRSHLDGVVVTRGAEGCDLWVQGQRQHLPGVQATAVVDPTGCGDAFRAALLFGLERGWPLHALHRAGQPHRCAEDRLPWRAEPRDRRRGPARAVGL